MFPFDKKRLVGAACAVTIAAAVTVGAMTIATAPAEARVFIGFGFPAPYYAPYYGYPGFFVGGGFGPRAYWHHPFVRRGFHHPFVRRVFHHPVHRPFVRHVVNHGGRHWR